MCVFLISSYWSLFRVVRQVVMHISAYCTGIENVLPNGIRKFEPLNSYHIKTR